MDSRIQRAVDPEAKRGGPGNDDALRHVLRIRISVLLTCPLCCKHTAVDFPVAARGNLNLKKEILWESETASESEARAKQSEYILSLRSYDPAIGYNTTPHVHLPA